MYIQSIHFVANFVCGKGDAVNGNRENHRHVCGFAVINLEFGKILVES
jgi:hypothetical protein